MPRTNATLVRGIISIPVAFPDASLDPYIISANELVTEFCDKPAYGYSDTRLELIERWLAAHFYSVFSPRQLSAMAGPVQNTIESKVDLRLQVTRHGQQALILDTAGGLAAWNNSAGKVTLPPPAVKLLLGGANGVIWLGKDCPPRNEGV